MEGPNAEKLLGVFKTKTGIATAQQPNGKWAASIEGREHMVLGCDTEIEAVRAVCNANRVLILV